MSDEPIHVTPVNDLRQHADSADCWCEPRIEDRFTLSPVDATGQEMEITGGIRIIIHHSLDRRERHERQN